MITKESKILTVDPMGIHPLLRKEPYWANWFVLYDKDGKGRKVPSYGKTALTGQYWEEKGLPFREALNRIPKGGGLALSLTLRNDYACIDIDNYKPGDPRLAKILSLAPHAWCEYSPSGTGIHIWGKLPNKSAYLRPEHKIIGYCGKEYEWWATGRNMTMTGHHIYGNEFPDLTAAVRFCDSFRPKIVAVEHEVKPIGIPAQKVLEVALRNAEFKKMYTEGHTKDGDKSSEDFKFCCNLWYWFGSFGDDTVESIFRKSAMYRPDKGQHYPPMTVKNAKSRWNGQYYKKYKTKK